jgi:hypothetical protein
MLRRASALVVPAVLAASFGLAAGAARAGTEAAATITGPEIHDHIAFLASDALLGRDTGSGGERTAGEYVARQLAADGLTPMGEDGTFFLKFDVAGEPTLTRAEMRMDRDGFYREFEPRKDMVPFGFSATGDVDAPVVFAGYGISDPAHGYDDYAGLDVKGKAVLVLRHEPHETSATRLSRNAFFSTKAEVAKAHGAVAVLVVTDPLHHEHDDSLVPFGADGREGDAGLVALQVRQGLVEGLFRLAGRDLAAEQKALDDEGKPRGFDLGARLQAHVAIDRHPLHARDVVARLEGSDPALKDEVVVIGAHYDHIGLGHFGALDPDAEGQIHNGADDNASGTAGLLEIAQAFGRSGQRPKRTVLFVAFSGEERGLLGSEYFCAHPTVPIDHVVAMINLDMIGRLRDDKLEVGGVGTSPGFRDLATEALAAQHLTAAFDARVSNDSDHASFYAAKVPVLFFFTGMHADYHRATDDVEKINGDGAARVARAAYLCADRLANADARPQYVQVAPETGGDRPRLGVLLDRSRETGGVGIQRVVEASPAGKAGLQAGDIVVRFGDIIVDQPRDLLRALGEHQFGDTVQVVVKRGEQELTLSVTLTKDD